MYLFDKNEYVIKLKYILKSFFSLSKCILQLMKIKELFDTKPLSADKGYWFKKKVAQTTVYWYTCPKFPLGIYIQ